MRAQFVVLGKIKMRLAENSIDEIDFDFFS